MSHLMAGHPAYEGGWGRPRQAHYLLQLVYVYGFRVKGHHNIESKHVKEHGMVRVVCVWRGGHKEDVRGRMTVSEQQHLPMNYLEIYGYCHTLVTKGLLLCHMKRLEHCCSS